ncbi:hypothetical protein [Pseudomonas coronafaciens]|uniref:hypothetical protein n=1 Tax=Pseudomonas coronafaciens TaxID=53409 RepID=UPI000F3C836B|nr:hypothetical protein [Pseudomonas coronafaciens]RMP23357.1 hypothetical protein ALQ25_03394 [Pseudomonas coronafaciens pv. atropurpurea]
MKTTIGSLSHKRLEHTLSKLQDTAKKRFAKLSVFPISSWEDDCWSYCGKSNIYFNKNDISPEMSSVLKVFLVDILWHRRSSRHLTPSGVKKPMDAAKLFSKAGVLSLWDIDQVSYWRVLEKLAARTSAEGYVHGVNSFIAFLAENELLIENIDIVAGKTFRSADEYGRVAKGDKMPLPELVKAVIGLKWAIAGQWDGSIRAEMDMLCVLTQIFQYGLGLRIGEVLRLPENCLVSINGELYCRVWTAKGSAPEARYIPKIWRVAISDAVDRIKAICAPYRESARAIESGAIISELKHRLASRAEAIEDRISRDLVKLHSFAEENERHAVVRLASKRAIVGDSLIPLQDLGGYLPICSESLGDYQLLKTYKRWGFSITSSQIGHNRFKHFVKGEDVQRRLNELVQFRKNFITYRELYELIQGAEHHGAPSSSFFTEHMQYVNLSRLHSYALFGREETSPHGQSIFDLESAEKVIRNVVGGGYEFLNEIPKSELKNVYPELFNSLNSVGKSDHATGFYSKVKISDRRVRFSIKVSSGPMRYKITSGYMADATSIAPAVSDWFVEINAKVSSELVASIKDETLEDGLEISSRSFNISQRVSDHLFVVPSNSGGVYNPKIPVVLGYYYVLHALTPSKDDPAKQSAFSRYGVETDQALIYSFKTHKGRHWQTNSLFRAGLAASIVNKWMGRTELQGAHYDHQTPRERAARVGELMLDQQSRFIGHLPETVKRWSEQLIPATNIQELLTSTLQTVHHGPMGYCVRDINLKPCVYHLKCLTGANGLGCREFVFDLQDPGQRKKLEAERDKAEIELSRLFELMDHARIPVESVEMHIEHQMTVFRNSTAVLEKSELILTQAQADEAKDFMPFRHDGSKPDDCAFQCGNS